MDNYIPNKKYKILSENGEFVDFDGLYSSLSANLYENDGITYTGDHRIKDTATGEWNKITDLPGTKMIDGEELVYDVLNVDKYSSYVSNETSKRLDNLCDSDLVTIQLDDGTEVIIKYEEIRRIKKDENIPTNCLKGYVSRRPNEN